ncbi:ABC transporter permease [Halobacillus halophilus]|uniref:ABC transporter permease n=1 Tax=Halobacillus halophilus TaxID=1570 RepID=UPI001CD1BC60|nr:ABC transporter permease subunit [Halobacillus halophilus]MCA1012910.1 ABC transporter permease subunit [Halobacillus halophilus]
MKLFNNKSVYLLIPALLFLTLPLYGFFSAIFQSLSGGDRWTFEYYLDLLESTRFLSSIWFSIRTTLIATIVSLIIGVLITRSFYPYLEHHVPRLLVWLPMLFPHFVWGYMIILLLSETGLAAQLLVEAGVLQNSSAFPIWTRDPQGIGIIVTYVWKEVPFVILMLLPVYGSIKPGYYDLVKTLGGSKFRQFTAIEWPAIFPVLIETALIVFSFTISAYEVPALMGTTFPEMISVLSYEWFYGSGWEDRPMSFAAMVSLSLLILAFSAAGFSILQKKRWRAMRGRSI